MVAPVVAAGVQAAGELAGGLMDMYQTNKSNEFSWEKQKKVLQNQVQWRVEDAVKAGLHPLAALGLSPASGPQALSSNIGSHLSQMGQSLGRATEAALTPEDKLAAEAARLALTRGRLENDFLRAQIASELVRTKQQGTPGVPGFGATGPGKYVRSSVADMVSGGKRPPEGAVLDPNTNTVILPPAVSAQFKEDIEGELSGEAQGIDNWIRRWFRENWFWNSGLEGSNFGYPTVENKPRHRMREVGSPRY